MPKRKILPVALTIAGSDSGGGAGIQADLKTFAALGVHGVSAVTCITAQNPRAIHAIHACPPRMLRSQLDALFEEFPPAAAKTGMLFSDRLIRIVLERFSVPRHPPLVVDPVMAATSGRLLLKPGARRPLGKLLEKAALVTPNLPEAEALTGLALRNEKEMAAAARAIHERFGCAVLLKGGHLGGAAHAVDIFFDGRKEARFAAPFVRGVSTHGTGCTLSAAITAWLARGDSLLEAVEKGKQFITAAIRGSRVAAGHFILHQVPEAARS